MNNALKPGLPQVTGLACAAIAAAALLGWTLGIGHLTSVFPGLPTMVPVTALMTLAACAALWRLAARHSAIIGRQVDHMVHVVDDLLDISRVRRGLIRLDKAPVDLFAAVCEAIEQVRPQIAQRRHELHTDLPHAHPGVTGDHKRLVQIVANLLGNAARYTPEGGNIRLALRTGADTVEVSVQDDGIGIDAALLPQVFDPFTQGQRGAAGGLGIGLALVRHLTELHEGRIEAHSDGPGSGSSFVLTLPRLPLPMGAGTAHTACDPGTAD